MRAPLAKRPARAGVEEAGLDAERERVFSGRGREGECVCRARAPLRVSVCRASLAGLGRSREMCCEGLASWSVREGQIKERTRAALKSRRRRRRRRLPPPTARRGLLLRLPPALLRPAYTTSSPPSPRHRVSPPHPLEIHTHTHVSREHTPFEPEEQRERGTLNPRNRHHGRGGRRRRRRVAPGQAGHAPPGPPGRRGRRRGR